MDGQKVKSFAQIGSTSVAKRKGMARERHVLQDAQHVLHVCHVCMAYVCHKHRF